MAWLELRKKRGGVYDLWKKGQAIQEDCKDVHEVIQREN